jgi:hypothetical protein
MRKCRHRNPRTGMWRAGAQDWLNNTCLIVDRLVCDDCGAWLPLGPSNDAPAAVAVEIRAAEIAALGIGTPLLWIARDEEHGWRDFANEDGGGDCHCSEAVRHDDKNWHTGYLARCIVEHDEKVQR